MPRETILICPLSGARTLDTTGETVPDGLPEITDPEEGDILPAGWGQIRVRVAVPNPAIAEHAADLAEYERTLEAAVTEQAGIAAQMLEDPQVPDEEKARIRAPGFRAELRETVIGILASQGMTAPDEPEIEHPIVWEEREYEVLSPDALGAFFAAVGPAGFFAAAKEA